MQPGTTIGATGVQAGTDGRFFVPAWVGDSVEIVVFGPGGSGCPVPVPTLTARTADGPVAAGGQVPVGAEVTFDTSGSDLRGWSLVEVDWDLDGELDDGAQGDGYEVKARRPHVIEDSSSPAPPMTQSVRFDTAGTHVVRARILTTAGTAVISREIEVGAGAVAPIASFTAPQFGTAGQSVRFDASASRAQPDGSGAALRFEWDYGDGGGWRAGQAVQTHTYASAGTYAVRVKVTDSSNGRATESAARQVSIRQAQRREPTTPTTPTTPTIPTTPTTPTTPVPPADGKRAGADAEGDDGGLGERPADASARLPRGRDELQRQRRGQNGERGRGQRGEEKGESEEKRAHARQGDVHRDGWRDRDRQGEAVGGRSQAAGESEEAQGRRHRRDERRGRQRQHAEKDDHAHRRQGESESERQKEVAPTQAPT